MKPSILIVDDEIDIRELLCKGFEKQGFQVFSAENGTKALELLKTAEVSIVLSDIRMSGGSGIDLLKGIKAKNHSTPVVLLMSGFADISREEVYSLGAEDLVAKPFVRQELVALISNKLLPKADRLNKVPTAPNRLTIEKELGELGRLEGNVGVTLGQGGICLSSEGLKAELGYPVQFQIKFRGGKLSKIEGNGIVRWVRRQKVNQLLPGCGIEFLYLTDEVRQTVLDQIESLNPQSFIPSV